MLQISEILSLPLDAITETFGILARRGAGKTYTGAVLVEEFIKASAPVVVLDPVGAWWGLRSSADGKSAGLPVVILGGEHGDVPLEPTGGKIIADLVVDDPRPLILDLSGFDSNAAQDRFVADFAEHLYRRKAQNRSPLHLMFDEADSFAPQRPMPGQARMLGAIEALVRRGRQRGIGATFITQRPAVLNKNVLTQIEVLVVLQITAPQDRAAIEEWVKGHGTPQQCDELLKSLASLQKGEAWFWSPSRFDLFQRLQVRARETFDSGATPKMGDAVISPHELAPVDLEALRERLSLTVEAAKQNNPEYWKEEAARWKKEAEKGIERVVEKRVEVRVEVPILREGEVDRLQETADNLTALAKDLLQQANDIRAVLRLPSPAPQPEVIEKTPGIPRPYEKPATAKAPESKVAKPKSAAASLNSMQRKILTALAQHPAGRSKKQIALLTGYALNGGSFGAAFSDLKRADYIGGEAALYFITRSGEGALGPFEKLPTGTALREYWCRQLNTCERAIIEALGNVYPRALTKVEIANATVYEVKGGSFGAALSRLKVLDLIEGQGEMSLAAELADGR